MNEITELLKSPVFWFASVIISFLISFFASFAKDWTSNWFESRRIKKINEAKVRQKNFDLKVEKIKNDMSLVSIYQNNIIYQKIRQVFYLTIILILMIFIITNVRNNNYDLASIFVILGSFTYWQNTRVSKYLYELTAVINEVLDDDEYHFRG